MHYIQFLRSLHRTLRPEAYLEIGVARGRSMAESRCRTVGVDPAFHVQHELRADVRLYRTTSDDFFDRFDPLEHTGGDPFDLAFIDGMHLFEFAFRDFINTERNSRSTGVIVFDDVLPRTVDEAARDRHTQAWTGDVFPILSVLEKWRPGVATILVDTQPTGLLLVIGLDPSDTTLADNYDQIVTEMRRPDPQSVPEHLLTRSSVQAPTRVLSSQVLTCLAQRRSTAAEESTRADLDAALVRDLGPAYGIETART